MRQKEKKRQFVKCMFYIFHLLLGMRRSSFGHMYVCACAVTFVCVSACVHEPFFWYDVPAFFPKLSLPLFVSLNVMINNNKKKRKRGERKQCCAVRDDFMFSTGSSTHTCVGIYTHTYSNATAGSLCFSFYFWRSVNVQCSVPLPCTTCFLRFSSHGSPL